ncbi:MAG: hypothetical protein ABEH58_09815, partial [Haloplanus sp.]
DNCPDDMADFLLNKFELSRDALYQVNGPVNLNRLLAVYDLVDRADLKFAPFQQAIPTGLHPNGNIFDTIARRDVVLHHPYDAFSPVLDFLRQAAGDPNVLAVKQTLYRTGPDSPVVSAGVPADVGVGPDSVWVGRDSVRVESGRSASVRTARRPSGVRTPPAEAGRRREPRRRDTVRSDPRHRWNPASSASRRRTGVGGSRRSRRQPVRRS